ncbi:MAG: ribonuclease HI family protein [Leptospiraceae bacterium]|nr:ribonuclease HI family protein [Leptospiraceae bacterium]MCP5513305.1 ribonuclease HI family protein [Leptospiraceae bacterium]
MLNLFCDGASKGNPGLSAIGVSAKRTEESPEEIFSISELIGQNTNNIAEWTALLRGLERSIHLGEKDLRVYMDSELVVKQMKGIYKTKHPGLIPIKKQVDELVTHLNSFEIIHIRREKNKRADELANLAYNQN